MRTLETLYDEMAAALQFPQYFGENWPAFNECLSEMDWLSPRGRDSDPGVRAWRSPSRSGWL